MKYIKLFLIFILIFPAGLVLSGETIHKIERLVNPSQIIVDKTNNEIFIVDGISINVFSGSELRLKKKFGKHGEGPGEFLPPVSINLNPDIILVNSKNRVSFFSREFVFLSEKKSVSGKRFAKTENGFAGQGFKIIGQDGYETFNFYDKDIAKGVEIVSRKSPIQRSGKIPVLSSPFIFRVYNNTVYYSFNDKLELGASQNTKNKSNKIKIEYENKSFTQTDKIKFENYFKTNPRTRKNFEILKQRLEYPDQYPAIRTFLVENGFIYVITHKKNKKGSSETLIFQTNGKFVSKSFFPIEDMNIFRPYPFFISGSELFQLVETEDEKWELHINQI